MLVSRPLLHGIALITLTFSSIAAFAQHIIDERTQGGQPRMERAHAADDVDQLSPDQLFQRAAAFQQGQGVAQDKDAAYYYFLESANQGSAKAQAVLGRMYKYKAENSPQYNDLAIHWLTRAAQAGLAPAQYDLAVMVYQGQGVAKDYETAFQWFVEAAKQHHAPAQYNAGLMSHQGRGAPVDNETALYWFHRACQQKITRACDAAAILEQKKQYELEEDDGKNDIRDEN